MLERPALNLKVVPADALPEGVRERLRPGETIDDAFGNPRRLPTHFYEVPSWEAALETKLAPDFGLWELIDVDVREADEIRRFPRYVPCALTILAAHLQVLRNEVGRVVRIAANGGYRSPAHAFSTTASPHMWGTAANIYRIGDDWMETEERVERYGQIARSVLPAANVRGWGRSRGYAFDHLHIDLGFVVAEPHAAEAFAETSDEREE